MRETRITIPEAILFGSTRGMLGAGLGLLLADRLSGEQRRAIGWTLFLIGALSTIPLALQVLGGHRLITSAGPRELSTSAPRAEATERLQGAWVQP